MNLKENRVKLFHFSLKIVQNLLLVEKESSTNLGCVMCSQL